MLQKKETPDEVITIAKQVQTNMTIIKPPLPKTHLGPGIRSNIS